MSDCDVVLCVQFMDECHLSYGMYLHAVLLAMLQSQLGVLSMEVQALQGSATAIVSDLGDFHKSDGKVLK